MFKLERDPNLIKLEQNVFQNLLNIKKEEDAKHNFVEAPLRRSNMVRHVSVEDAIKELIELEKNLK